MLKRERHQFIIQHLNIHNKVLSSDLSAQMGVSEDTIRRDLQLLAEENLLIKVHGGALSPSFHFTLQNVNVYSANEKHTIALKAASLITDGMFVLLSGGTTIRELVKVLPPNLNASFFTVSVPIALELMNHPSSEVYFLGNKLLKSAQMSVGAEVVQKLSEIEFDLCILGTNSIDSEAGITDLEWEVIEVKKAMIKSAKKVVSLAISEKLHSVQRLKVCSIESVHVLVTELEPTHQLLQAFAQKGCQLL